MSETNNIAIIILAAGSSSRMGQSKQLLAIDGEPLLLRTVKTALQSELASVVVVLGAQGKEHASALQNFSVDIIVHGDWQKGMGSSLKAGLKHVMSLPQDINSIIVLVCDQPSLSSRHLLKLIEKHTASGKSIIASLYADAPGVPALFEKKHFVELLAMEDNQGAKKVIQQNIEATELVSFPEGAIDLDTPEDYHQYINALKTEKPS